MTLLEERAQARGTERDGLVAVFVYGTLRVGMNNFMWAQACVRDTVEDCVAQGGLYFVRGGFGYPVAKFNEGGRIVGDVLYCDPDHEEFSAMVEMELRAGYQYREIEVVSPEGETLECVAFHYVRQPAGDKIPDGDWKKACGMFPDPVE